MFAILRNLDPMVYTHRSYVVSAGDDFSARRAVDFEAALSEAHPDTSAGAGTTGTYDISIVPRAREVHQSLLTTPLSALHCLAACSGVLYCPSFDAASLTARSGPEYPDLIVTNGPGTAVCVIFASLLIRFVSPILPSGLQAGRGGTGAMRTIYVESWARVKSLSLSGKILVRVVDRFLVQWEGLKGVGGRGEYVGVLV